MRDSYFHFLGTFQHAGKTIKAMSAIRNSIVTCGNVTQYAYCITILTDFADVNKLKGFRYTLQAKRR